MYWEYLECVSSSSARAGQELRQSQKRPHERRETLSVPSVSTSKPISLQNMGNTNKSWFTFETEEQVRPAQRAWGAKHRVDRLSLIVAKFRGKHDRGRLDQQDMTMLDVGILLGESRGPGRLGAACIFAVPLQWIWRYGNCGQGQATSR